MGRVSSKVGENSSVDEDSLFDKPRTGRLAVEGRFYRQTRFVDSGAEKEILEPGEDLRLRGNLTSMSEARPASRLTNLAVVLLI